MLFSESFNFPRKGVVIGAFILCLLAGAWILFKDLNAQSMWEDEIYFTNFVIDQPSFSETINRVRAGDHSPLYLVMLRLQIGVHAFFKLPVTDGSLRIIAAVSGFLCIPAIFLLMGRVFNRWEPAVLAGFLAALSGFNLYYSQEVRMYTLIMLFASLMLYFQLSIWNAGTGRLQKLPAVGYVLCGVILLYASLIALFFVAGAGIGLLIWSLISYKKYPHRWWQVVIMGSMIGLLFSPWMGEMFKKSLDMSGGLQGQVITNPRELFKFSMENLMFHSWKIGTAYTLVNKLIRVLMLFALVHLWESKHREKHAQILLGFGITFLLHFILTYNKEFQFGKYFAAWWPFAVYFLVAGISGFVILWQRVKPELKWAAIGLTMLLLAGYFRVQYQQINYYFTGYTKSNWRDGVRYVKARENENPALLLVNNWQGMCVEYYNEKVKTLQINDLNQAEIKDQSIYYINTEPIEKYNPAKDFHFQKVETPVKGIEIYLVKN